MLKNFNIVKTLVFKEHKVDKNVQHFLLHYKNNQLKLDSSDEEGIYSWSNIINESDSEGSDLLEKI